MSKTNELALLQRLLEHSQFEAATELAQKRGLSLDAVHAVQFDSMPVSASSVALHLEAMRDLDYVLGECISRVAETSDAQRTLLLFGLKLTVPSSVRSAVVAPASLSDCDDTIALEAPSNPNIIN